MIYLRNLKIYSYPNLPINRQGIINKNGDFISFYPIDKETFSENSIKEFMEEFYNIDINSILEKKELYQFRQGVYNYKAILVDYLEYAIYESYLNKSLAVIKVPSNVTEEQKNTLIKLVTLNNNDIESLIPIKEKVKVKKY